MADHNDLIGGGMCPICKSAWRGRDACGHGWPDIDKWKLDQAKKATVKSYDDQEKHMRSIVQDELRRAGLLPEPTPEHSYNRSDIPDGTPVMAYLNGSKKSFKCVCGCNGFTIVDGLWSCNACPREYEGT